MAARFRRLPKLVKAQPSLWIVKMVMAIDEATATGQAVQALQERRIVARIGNQPSIRQGR